MLRVSPVVLFFRPTMAMMSPAKMAFLSSRWLACICSMRPIRSFLSLVVLEMDAFLLLRCQATRM